MDYNTIGIVAGTALGNSPGNGRGPHIAPFLADRENSGIYILANHCRSPRLIAVGVARINNGDAFSGRNEISASRP